MSTRLYLRLPDPVAWEALAAALPEGTQADVLEYPVMHTTGTATIVTSTITEVVRPAVLDENGVEFEAEVVHSYQRPEEVAATVAVPGFLVNVVLPGEPPPELVAHAVNPTRPRRVFFGAPWLSVPEVLPDDGDTVLVQRPVGAPADDALLADVEIEVVRRKLASEQRIERRALHAANLALVELRQRVARMRDERQAAVDEVAQALARHVAAAGAVADAVQIRDAALARRDALLEERVRLLAERQAAVDLLSSLAGAARIPVLQQREAAGLRLDQIGVELEDARGALEHARETLERARASRAAAGDALGVAQAARDSAGAEIEGARAQITQLRGERDALRELIEQHG